MDSSARRAPYFFLSYAHTPQRAWVSKFYKELSAIVLEHTDWPTELPIAFMDQSELRNGEDWQDGIAEALACCRVLVPLYSRRYFTRVECGREWRAFHRRVLAHRARNAVGPVPIVPALWTPVEDEHIPAAARYVHVDFGAIHPAYAREGLFTLIKNSRYRRAYLDVVDQLAKQIIAAAEDRPMTPIPVKDLDLTQDAFGRSMARASPDHRLTIMVAAPTLDRMPPGRAADCYGTTSQAWRPFHPYSARPVAIDAERVARALDHQTLIVPAGDALPQDWSRPETGLGLVLVDPWWALDPSNARALRHIDRVGAGQVGVLVVWNPQDPQTRENADQLRRALRNVGPRLLGDPKVPAALGAPHVHSVEELYRHLPPVLDRALNRYLTRAGEESPPPGHDEGGPDGD